MNLNKKVIAIDGPSASGKGTIAFQVAKALGFNYLDSGALYRLTALYAQKKNISWHDERSLADAAQMLPVSFLENAILLNNEDVTKEIRTEEIGMAASVVARLSQVRAALLQRQRKFLTNKGLVADGRDMGSVVFPAAELKVFLTANAEVRAQRRAKQLGLPCEGEVYQKILNDIKTRDKADKNRSVAPLQQLQDAKLLDTSSMTIEEAVKKVIDWYEKIKNHV